MRRELKKKLAITKTRSWQIAEADNFLLFQICRFEKKIFKIKA